MKDRIKDHFRNNKKWRNKEITAAAHVWLKKHAGMDYKPPVLKLLKQASSH